MAEFADYIVSGAFFMMVALSILRACSAWLIPTPTHQLVTYANQHARLEQAREQLVTVLSRVLAIVGLLSLLFVLPGALAHGVPFLIPVYFGTVIGVWVIAFQRRWTYQLRIGILIVEVYLLGVVQLANFGVTADVISFLFLTILLTALFIGGEKSVIALCVSVSTLLGFGLLLGQGIYVPPALQMKPTLLGDMLITVFVFAAVACTIQIGIATLLRSLVESSREEQQIRAELQREHMLLEERVTERTIELAVARDLAISANTDSTHQREYLEALHRATIDLLNYRDLDELLSAIVERATAILDAPYGKIMLFDEDELAVQACTTNQSFLRGDRLSRSEGKIAWQAFDTQQPVVIDDYSSRSDRRAIGAGVSLHAIADFPIVVGSECLGVLALGRTVPEYPFSRAQIQYGSMLARLVAVIIDNMRQYEMTQREIRERQRINIALEATAADLRMQNAELDAFAHTVAHDIKNPLFSLVGFIQLLQFTQHELTSEQIDQELQKILRLGFGLGTIVDELLMLASMRSNESITLWPLAMDQIVANLDDRLNDLVLQYGATISRPASWPAALGHETWVTEVWANYVSNAIKYGGTPPHVELGADAPEDGLVRFWVRDNGNGLDIEQQQRLFTAFTRLHIDQAPGTGLGLSIVQRIIEKLGGQVGVESVIGQGSTFYFTLPAQPHEEETPATVTSLPDLSATENTTVVPPMMLGRVLLAEDNTVNQAMIAQMVRRIGYEVDVASNGREAVEACAVQAYSIVLMDIQMPELDGIAATQQIRAFGSMIQQPWIVALSANSLPDTYRHPREAGLDGFLQKPIVLEELRKALERYTTQSATVSVSDPV